MTEICNNNLINPNWAQHGYIQVYTGDGKGKTTASLGLAMRALGRCWKVLIVMFTKGGNDYGELNSFTELSPTISDNLRIIQAGLDRVIYKENQNEQDEQEIKKGWEIAKQAIKNHDYQLIILDEANIAIDMGIIDVDEVVKTLQNKPEEMEIVLTGRNAHQKIIDIGCGGGFPSIPLCICNENINILLCSWGIDRHFL